MADLKECPRCGRRGPIDELETQTGLKSDVDYDYCPQCGEEVMDAYTEADRTIDLAIERRLEETN